MQPPLKTLSITFCPFETMTQCTFQKGHLGIGMVGRRAWESSIMNYEQKYSTKCDGIEAIFIIELCYTLAIFILLFFGWQVTKTVEIKLPLTSKQWTVAESAMYPVVLFHCYLLLFCPQSHNKTFQCTLFAATLYRVVFCITLYFYIFVFSA